MTSRQDTTFMATVLHNQAYQKLFYLFSQHTALEFNKTSIFLRNLTV